MPTRLLIILLSLCSSAVAAVEVPATAEHWTRAERIGFSRYLGAPAMLLQGGPYVVADSKVANGRIDVDVAMHGQRGFVGVLFRHQDDDNHELFYIRPHKSRLPDAVQYTPAINGLTAWQLYSEDYTAAAEMPHDRWVHLRVEFTGREARIHIDGADEPALVVDLKGDFGAGAVGLWGRNVAHFANFRYEAFPDTSIPPRPAHAAPEGVVDGWEITGTYERADVDPAVVPADATWTPVALEAPGMVNLSRYRSLLPDAARAYPEQSRDVVFARTFIHADRAGPRRIRIGYSDGVTVLLNGRPLWQASAAFGERYPFALGILGTENDALWLPLEAGENELVLAVEEAFGGWGFAARLE